LKFVKRLKRAAQAFFRETISSVDVDDDKWSPILGSKRDLTPYAQSKALEVAYFLYERNPMAKRLINMTSEYLVAEGIRIKAEEKEIQQFLDDFWSENDLHNLNLQFIKELGLWGEQCYRLYPNDSSGRCKLGYIDPGNIEIVQLNPENCLEISNIFIKNKEGDPTAVPPVKKLDALQDGIIYTGDTFFFKINSVISASRGRSDLLAPADYLDLVSQFVFSRGERSIFGNAWMWDVLCEGMDQTQIEEFAKKQGVPEPGAARYHNEKVKWSAVAPDLKAHDASFDGRLLKTFCLGSLGYPEHFFGEGGDVNRATALEMHEPVTKMLTARQQFVSGMFTKILKFVIAWGKAKGSLKPGVNEAFQLFFPEISGKDMQRSGLTMLYLAQSLSIAVKANWITGADAARVYAQVASSFGPNVDPVENPKPAKDQSPTAPDKPVKGDKVDK